jgi:hypothetical protein
MWHGCQLLFNFATINFIIFIICCILLLQVLIHAARNFALQEHAIESTESVSFLCFTGVFFIYCHVIEWLWMESGLVIKLVILLNIVTTSNYNCFNYLHILQFATACTRSSQSVVFSLIFIRVFSILLCVFLRLL